MKPSSLIHRKNKTKIKRHDQTSVTSNPAISKNQNSKIVVFHWNIPFYHEMTAIYSTLSVNRHELWLRLNDEFIYKS